MRTGLNLCERNGVSEERVQSCVRAMFPPEEDFAKAIAMAAQTVGLPQAPEFHVSVVEDRDWIEHIQSTYRPLQVAPDLWIVPSWCSPPDPSAISVILEPGLAFGTGEHATTQLCLRSLRDSLRGGELVLDYGCGSGILSLTALKIGARRAVGVDIDSMAVSSSRYNASLNGFDEQSFQVFIAAEGGPDPVPSGAASSAVPDGAVGLGGEVGRNGVAGQFDFVVANILLNPLCNMVERISGYARAGGQVALSGILEEQVERVCESYSAYIEDIKVTSDGGWACVQGRRKGDGTSSLQSGKAVS